MTEGTRSTDLPLKSSLDEFIGHKDSGAGPELVRATRSVVAAQLMIDSGVAFATWAALSATTGTAAGQRAEVYGDAGTHTDPVVGGTVSNSGVFGWSTSPAGWRWLAVDLAASFQEQIDAKAPKASPTLTGSPRAPTAAAGDNSTLLANTAFVQGEFSKHQPYEAATRPGDSPGLYTSDHAGAPVSVTPLTAVNVVVGAEGRSYRLTVAGVVAVREAIWAIPNRSYKFRAAYRRIVDPSDPLSDAVQTGVAWLDASYAMISLEVLNNDGAATVANGIRSFAFDLSAAPSGAKFARPYVRTFGTGNTTDVEEIAITDVTDLSLASSSNYRGTWNATTNTPTLVSSVGTTGDYYDVSVAGTTSINGINSWAVRDRIKFNGTAWEKLANDNVTPNYLSGEGILIDQVGQDVTVAMDVPALTNNTSALDPTKFSLAAYNTDAAEHQEIAFDKLPGNRRRPFVILAMGQSNIVQEPAYSWTPEPNLKVWNWDGTYSGIGTAFAALDGTKANVVWSFANEIAKQHPHLDVRVVKIAVGGMPIEHFIHGASYLFSSDTSGSSPASGYFKLNAAPNLATQLVIHQLDKNAIDKGGILTETLLGQKIYLVDQTSGATATYTVSLAAVWDDPGDKITVGVTYVSGSGTFTNGDSVLVLGEPDIWAILTNNITPALAAAGVTKIDQFYWWQGESNARDPRRYVEDFTTFHTQLIGESWFDPQTPMMISGITSNAVTGNTAFGLVNWFLQKCVALDPDRRKFTYPAAFPQSYWDSGVGYIHMLATGYMLAGQQAFNIWRGKAGRGAFPGAVYDTDLGAWTFNGTRQQSYSFDFNPWRSTPDPARGIIARFYNDAAGAANGSMIGFGASIGGAWALGQIPGATSFGIYQNRTALADGTLQYFISSVGLHGVNTASPLTRHYVEDSNPARGIVGGLRNSNASSSTGAMLMVSAAGLGTGTFGFDASSLAIYISRSTVGDGTKVCAFSASAVLPGADNAFTLGNGSFRWSTVYAATGTINTSDGRMKMDVAPSALGLDFIKALRPVSYRWIEGGAKQVEVEDAEEFEEIETEEIVEKYTDHVVDNGVAIEFEKERKVKREVADLVPVVDASGAVVYDIEPATDDVRDENGDLVIEGTPERRVQRTIAVPRMVKRTRTIKRTEIVKTPGKRTHYGLIAQEVAEAIKASGAGDFAGHVLDDASNPDSTQGLRYDQFIAPLIKAVQELSAKVAALEAKLPQ